MSHGKSLIRFYSLPDECYPYLLVNRKNYRTLYRRQFAHAIIDSGVMDFVHENVKEYPRAFLRKWIHQAQQLSLIWPNKVWCVIPDYPDDYNPGQFGDNVERTLTNIEEYLEIESVSWLPVIQSYYLNPFSFLLSCEKVKKLIGDYPQVAIGTICKCKSLWFIEYCTKAARKFFPKSWLHAFGLTLNALPRVAHLLDSFDSMAWTFPRGPGHSCKNRRERAEYFHAYLAKIASYMEN